MGIVRIPGTFDAVTVAPQTEKLSLYRLYGTGTGIATYEDEVSRSHGRPNGH